MNKRTAAFPITLFLATLLIASLLSGCASRKFVRTELATGIESSEERTGTQLTELSDQIERNQNAISEADQRLDEQKQELASLSKTAREALERAVEAGKLAEGTLVSETVLSNDQVSFGLDKSQLSDEGRQALDQFAGPLRAENAGIYVEIQGHTDASGADDYNLSLGERRAESVRRYLSTEHSLPLHRMSVISYGESSPSYDNSTPEGRGRNRRVVLVVLR